MASERGEKLNENSIILSQNMDMDKLLLHLQKASIDTSTYGIGNAKPLERLLKEINEGETVLSVDTSGNMHRHVNVL